MARIELAWELGGNLGHVSVLLPIALALKDRGHEVRLFLREIAPARDFPGADQVASEGAPIWVGPTPYPNPINFGQILLNFGYANPSQLEPLIEAWRERLSGADLIVSHCSPSALIAARTLGIQSVEISQGFHVPPAAFPTPALREWESVPIPALQAADLQSLEAINAALSRHSSAPLRTLGDLYSSRSVLLTYPEIDTYVNRSDAQYVGIVPTGESGAVPVWPAGSGPRVFAYVYSHYVGLPNLLAALAELDVPTLAFCRDIDPGLKARYQSSTLRFSDAPMSVSAMVPQSDLVICHANHQMTAQALLAGKPLLLLPTQVEQMLIARRVERIGAGVTVAPVSPTSDFALPLAILAEGKGHAECARAFAARYDRLDRAAMLAGIADRCEQRLASRR
jgi:UDP:flavonoid glycosyltransferase YjiC (YdhE family)